MVTMTSDHVTTTSSIKIYGIPGTHFHLHTAPISFRKRYENGERGSTLPQKNHTHAREQQESKEKVEETSSSEMSM